MSPIDLDRPCPHRNFAAAVAVGRIGEGDSSDGLPTWYSADITVKCADCGEPFRWVGVPAGMDARHPMVSVDETELRAPMRPASGDPDFGMGIPGFAVRKASGDADLLDQPVYVTDDDWLRCNHGGCNTDGFMSLPGRRVSLRTVAEGIHDHYRTEHPDGPPRPVPSEEGKPRG